MSKKPGMRMKNPAEWQDYKDTAGRDVLFAHYGYKDAGDMSSLELKAMAEKMPEDFEMVLYSDFVDDTKAHKYRAGVFVNHQTKEVVIASAGTRFGATVAGAHDLYNDAVLAMEKMPPKLKSAGVLNQMLLDSLGDKASEYKFHYTGHSLGAALSDMAAADMAIRCRNANLDLAVGDTKKISTMTFDNPGAKRVVEKMYKNAGLNPSSYSQDADYRGVNNGKNLINQATSHAGRMWEIVPDGQNNEPNAAQTWAQYIAHKLQRITPIISRVIETLSFGGLKRQIDSHALSNFENVLVKEQGSVRDADTVSRKKPYLIEFLTGCKKMLFDKKTFPAITAFKEERGDEGRQEFVMVNPDGRFATVSKVELAKARAAAVERGGEFEAQKPMAKSARNGKEHHPKPVVVAKRGKESTRFRDRVASERERAPTPSGRSH